MDIDKTICERIKNLCNLECYMQDLLDNPDKYEGDIKPYPQNVIDELTEFAKYFYKLGLTTNENLHNKDIGYGGIVDDIIKVCAEYGIEPTQETIDALTVAYINKFDVYIKNNRNKWEDKKNLKKD